MRRVVLVLGLAVAVVCGSVLPARATAPAGWGEWVMPAGTICVQTSGNAEVARAALAWDSSDASVRPRTSCYGYTRNMTVLFAGRNDPAGYWCARTGTAAGWSWRYVRGEWVWTPSAPLIEINYATVWRTKCRATAGQRGHVYAHELGHVLGLAHNTEASVMGSWAYSAPTALDIDRVNQRY